MSANGYDGRNLLAPRGGPLHAPTPAPHDARFARYMSTLAGDAMNTAPTKFEAHCPSPGVLVVGCRGGLSWEDRELLRDGIRERAPQGTPLKAVVMDFASLEFVNSAGVGAICQLLGFVRERGARLIFVNVAPPLLRMFRMVGLDRSALVLDTVGQALAAAANENDTNWEIK